VALLRSLLRSELRRVTLRSSPPASVAEWRRRESNPQVQSRNSEVAKRLWQLLQDVGVSWEYTDDANWQSVATGHEELAELMTE
jgi:hypothetical protein